MNAIGTVPGAGNSTSILHYQFTDAFPFPAGRDADGILYYRLRQTDFDGKYQYSGIVAVTVSSSNKLEILALNKNGNESSIQYFISSPSGKPFNIEVTDRIGRVIVTKSSVERSGTINCSQFASGIYLFRVFDGDGYSVKKFVY